MAAPDERAEAMVLANRLLDQPWADPDDDLRVLARQLLRREERVAMVEALLRKWMSETPTPPQWHWSYGLHLETEALLKARR